MEQHTFRLFDQVKVTIRLDDSNIQHQKIRMALVDPEVSTPLRTGSSLAFFSFTRFHNSRLISDSRRERAGSRHGTRGQKSQTGPLI